jgi:hypothetical protein
MSHDASSSFQLAPVEEKMLTRCAWAPVWRGRRRTDSAVLWWWAWARRQCCWRGRWSGVSLP